MKKIVLAATSILGIGLLTINSIRRRNLLKIKQIGNCGIDEKKMDKKKFKMFSEKLNLNDVMNFSFSFGRRISEEEIIYGKQTLNFVKGENNVVLLKSRFSGRQEFIQSNEFLLYSRWNCDTITITITICRKLIYFAL